MPASALPAHKLFGSAFNSEYTRSKAATRACACCGTLPAPSANTTTCAPQRTWPIYPCMTIQYKTRTCSTAHSQQSDTVSCHHPTISALRTAASFVVTVRLQAKQEQKTRSQPANIPAAWPARARRRSAHPAAPQAPGRSRPSRPPRPSAAAGHAHARPASLPQSARTLTHFQDSTIQSTPGAVRALVLLPTWQSIARLNWYERVTRKSPPRGLRMIARSRQRTRYQ